MPAIIPPILARLGIFAGLGALLNPLIKTIAAFFGAAGKEIAGTLGVALAMLLLFFLLRILFMLVRAYVSIILLIIFSPLIIAFGAVSPAAIRGWFINLLANILVFPVTALLIGLGGIISGIIISSPQIWKAPILGPDNAMLAGLFSLGILIVIPEVDRIIKQFLNARGPEFGPPGISPQLQRGGQEFISRIAKKLTP